MRVFAIFGITNDGLNLAVQLLVLVLFAVYLALVSASQNGQMRHAGSIGFEQE